MSSHDYFDYAVAGGGCFGVSTALALQRMWPDARVILLEGTHRRTASKDVNKIIRTPYPDPDYVELATRAMARWTTEPYRQFFHRTSWIQIIRSGSHRSFMKGPQDRLLSPSEVMELAGTVQAPRLEEGEELWQNQDIGYVDATLALDAVATQASTLGVQRMEKDVTRIIVDGNGNCAGVEVAGGHIVKAGKTFICTGAWTVGLLESSNIPFPEDFLTVAGVGVGTLKLSAEEIEAFQNMPILVAERGEVMPSKRYGILKITSTDSFKIQNMDTLNTDVDPSVLTVNLAVLKRLIPQLAERRLDCWICPDLMTPYQHPIVDQVPGVAQLYVAAGGSYHSYKFLPLLGEMVVRRMLAQSADPDPLEDRLLARWGWNRQAETISVHRGLVPKGSSTATESRQDL